MATEQEARAKNEEVPRRLEFGEFGFLQFQKGPRAEVGVTGLSLEHDVLPALIRHLKNLNTVLPSRETSLAITKLEECWLWLGERRRLRQEQGVLDTYKPHA